MFAAFHFALSHSAIGQNRNSPQPDPPQRSIPKPTFLNAKPKPIDSASTNKPPLRITSAAQTIHGGVRIPTMIAKAEANKFSFVPPQSWRVQSAGRKKRIRLVQAATGSLISVDIFEHATPETDSLSAELLRARILARYPNAEITDEFSASALDSSGPAFDLAWSTGNAARMAARIAFTPFTGGHLEFSLVAPARTISRTYHDFNRLLLSFRHAPLNGNLELQPITPE